MTSSGGKPRPGGRTQRHTDLIFEHTLVLLAQHGYAALSFNDVAQAAGVSRSTLYRRWSSRAELVLDAISASLEEKIVPPDSGSLLGDLRGTLRQVGDYISTPLGAAVLVASIEIGPEAGQDRAGRWAARLTDFDPMFDRAVARGEIPPTFDREAALAMASGALYFQRIAAGEPIGPAWTDRVAAIWEALLTQH